MPNTRNTYSKRGNNRTNNFRNNSYGNSSFGGYRTSTGNNNSWNPTTYSPNKFNNQRDTIQAKIGSYRTISQQFTGSGKVTAFSPSTVNKWINWVNDGACVYSFSNVQFGRFFGARISSTTPTSACRFLQQKFGTGIKGVTRGKNNTWLVCATPRVTARPFTSYNW